MHSVQVYQNPCLYVLKGNSEEKRKFWNARKKLKLLDQYAVKVDSVKKKKAQFTAYYSNSADKRTRFVV